MIPLTLIETFAELDPQRPAVVDGHTALTWSDFATHVRSAAGALAARLGSGEEQRAVLIGDNCVDYVVTASALATLGVPWVGLDPLADEAILTHQLGEVDPTVVFLGLGAAVDCGASRTLAMGELVGEALAAPDKSCEALEQWQRPPFTAFGFTSGTTGMPKLVRRTSPSEQRRTETFVQRYGFDRDDTHLTTVPLSHASGHGWARLFLAVGATVLVPSAATPDDQVSLVHAHRVRTSLMVPPVLSAFATAAQGRRDADLSSLRFILTGGRHLHPRILRNATARLGPVVTSYYGTTETGVNLIADPADLAVSPRTSGLPLPGNEVCVIAGDGRPAAPGQVGRIGLASYMAMAGYVHHDEERLTVDGTEYLITADYGYLDAHAKTVLTYRDDGLAAPERVPGHDIEADLLEIDGITDAAVVRRAVPGSAPCLHAAVVVDSNADRDLIHKHADYVLEYRLARTMPCRVEIVDAIPYSPTGKVRTADLRALVASSNPAPPR